VHASPRRTQLGNDLPVGVAAVLSTVQNPQYILKSDAHKFQRSGEVMMNLETRFFDFCNRHPGAENIDDLVKTTGAVKGMKIADFFFQNRTIV
jgi:hypothetical protein